MELTTDLPWAQLGTLLGGGIAGLVFGAFWMGRHFLRSKKTDRSGEYATTVKREEWLLELSDLRSRIDETEAQATEARAAALAVQASLTVIGQMIENATRTLGDRLEGALRDMRERVDDHDESFTDHHGRLRSIETELRLGRHE